MLLINLGGGVAAAAAAKLQTNPFMIKSVYSINRVYYHHILVVIVEASV